MAKQIEMKNAERCIWDIGPYIFFYNGNCSGYNLKLVAKMNAMAKKYPSLKVREIDWRKKKKAHPLTPDEDLNKVSIYFQHKLEDEVLSPDEDTIKELFKKAIDFFNISIDIRIEKIGSRIFSDLKPPLIAKEEIIPNERQSIYLKNQKRRLLDQKLHFKEESILLSEQKIDYVVKKETQKTKEHGNPIKRIKLERELVNSSPSKKWYHDVNITELPCELFRPSPTKFSLKNIEILNSVKRISHRTENRPISQFPKKKKKINN